MSKNQLTEEQLAVLNKFARGHGRCWKAKLRAYWESGYYHSVVEEERPVLHGLRNALGPSWLARFDLVRARTS